MSTKRSKITASDLSVELLRKDVKNYHLSVNPPDGKVKMTVPLEVSDDAARLIIIKRLSWIRAHQDIFLGQARQSGREFISGETHYVWGKSYRLEVITSARKHTIQIKNNTHLMMRIQAGTTVDNKARLLNEWYRHQLKEVIPGLLEKWERVVGVNVADWGVKKMKTKWGSCNTSAKRIWLNLKLAKKPFECLEYILVHELVHLLERHHNHRFKSLLEKFMPQWKLYKKLLNSEPLANEEWNY